jgi:histidyl-tRNA synthetase
MASQINPPRGMRDFLPTEKAVRNDLLSKIVGTYASHGFQEIAPGVCPYRIFFRDFGRIAV